MENQGELILPMKPARQSMCKRRAVTGEKETRHIEREKTMSMKLTAGKDKSRGKQRGEHQTEKEKKKKSLLKEKRVRATKEVMMPQARRKKKHVPRKNAPPFTPHERGPQRLGMSRKKPQRRQQKTRR